MNHLQFQVAAGTIGITWNSRGFLTAIDWYENQSAKKNAAGSGHLGPQCIIEQLSTRDALFHIGISPDLAQLIKRLYHFFESGEPIGGVPWNLIDQSQWSDFQKRVYTALAMIPHGETRTYAWVAKRVSGSFENMVSPRAVGQALRKNPLPILIPCHRVVSANALGGFMGSVDPDQPELHLKRWLIEIESAYLSPTFSFLVQQASSSDTQLTGPH